MIQTHSFHVQWVSWACERVNESHLSSYESTFQHFSAFNSSLLSHVLLLLLLLLNRLSKTRTAIRKYENISETLRRACPYLKLTLTARNISVIRRFHGYHQSQRVDGATPRSGWMNLNESFERTNDSSLKTTRTHFHTWSKHTNYFSYARDITRRYKVISECFFFFNVRIC